MTSTTRIITIALAVLALSAPLAAAEPFPGSENGRPAGTTQPQDLRNPDNQAPRYVAPLQSRAPAAAADPKPVASSSGGTSPLVYIVPGLVLVGMLGAGVAFARMPRRSAA